MFQKFRSKCDLLTVYVMEAHPVGGWEATDQPFVVREAESIKERRETAKIFFDQVGMPGHIAVDSMESEAALLFAALPDRIYVVRSGRIIYQQDPGPFGYKPKELVDFLQKTCFE